MFIKFFMENPRITAVIGNDGFYGIYSFDRALIAFDRASDKLYVNC